MTNKTSEYEKELIKLFKLIIHRDTVKNLLDKRTRNVFSKYRTLAKDNNYPSEKKMREIVEIYGNKTIVIK